MHELVPMMRGSLTLPESFARRVALVGLATLLAASAVACVIGPKQDDPAGDKGIDTFADAGFTLDASAPSDGAGTALNTDSASPPAAEAGGAGDASCSDADACVGDAADGGDAGGASSDALGGD
jgi:hypothetical protein